MRSLTWDRPARIEELRTRIWRYLTPTVDVERMTLEAAALLQMPESDVVTLGRLHFLLSDEVKALLDDLPLLIRRLATTTAHEEEWSAERVRGAVLWSRTLGARLATGIPHLYVTAPARRAFQTPENELLVCMLDEVVRQGRESGWFLEGESGVGHEVGVRVGSAERWRLHRSLASVQRRAPTPRSLMRVRGGRHARAYSAALAAYAVFRSLVGQLDRAAIREAVEQRALVTRSDATLFELLCVFNILERLESAGWRFGPPTLVRGGLHLPGRHETERDLHLWYQGLPGELSRASRYAYVLSQHDFSQSARLRPDFVLWWKERQGTSRWLLVEAKMGVRRGVAESAREALLDLLGYRRDFEDVLEAGADVYGLGIAWGAELAPVAGAEVMLSTPDGIGAALSAVGL